MIVRDATRADFTDFYGYPPPMTLRGIVVESSLGVTAFGGYYPYNGMTVIFSDYKTVRKRDLIVAGRILLDRVKKIGVDIIAMPGEKGDTVLRHFGFTQYKSIYLLSPATGGND